MVGKGADRLDGLVGNLFDDGVNSYAYDPANRLVSASGGSSSVDYSYNGLGDRLQQTVGSTTTTYVLDLNAGLTQVLSDGTDTYTYGLGRISQVGTEDTEYFLGDALGSVRQMTDEAGGVIYAASYTPYGEVLSSAGESGSLYGYTGEQTDSTGMVYLRARYYSPTAGRFLTRDSWQGDYSRPASLNRWLYAYANPALYTDPSGFAASALERLFEIRNEVAPNAAEALFRLFEDKELYYEWGNEASRTSRGHLEWVLKVTTGGADPVTNALASYALVNFAIQFGSDCGFAEKFRDNQFYPVWYPNLNPDEARAKSNQVGHFLTAVNMSYNWILKPRATYGQGSVETQVMKRFALSMIIGHEQMSDVPAINIIGQPIQRFFNPSDLDYILWDCAIEFDSKGQEQWRDEALWAILNFPSDMKLGDVDPMRVGNSLQDLRLSLKGYRFAEWVWNNPNTNPIYAGAWLRKNLANR